MKSVKTLVILLGAAGLLPGCALLGAASVYEAIEYQERAKEGTVPPSDLVRRCNREGLVRDEEGRWQQDGPLTTACFSEAGWQITPEGWRRLP